MDRTYRYFYTLLISTFFLSSHLLFAWGEDDTVKVNKTADFTITGDGSAKNWDNSSWIDLKPRDPKEDRKTRAKMLYSSTGIYFLFHCEDTKLTSTLDTDFADLWTEDVIEVFLWTDEALPLYFEYEISPMNYELPLLIPNVDGTFLGWIPWKYRGDRKVIHRTSIEGGPMESGASVDGWKAEFFIPYALLTPLNNVPPREDTYWRLNLYRMDYDDGRSQWEWQPTGGTFHEFEKFGTLIFD